MTLVGLLRYNSRHRLYHGDKGLELNPIVSSSHRHDRDGNRTERRTWDAHEPLWLFRLRQRMFCFAGRQRCGRREGTVHGGTDMRGRRLQPGDLPDTWDMGPDGNRTCSWCGSVHPDDFMKICRAALTDPEYDVSMSDKRYKAYVRVPGVVNASQGAIKFYMHHAPAEPSDEEQRVFAEALRVCRQREDLRWQEMKMRMRL